MDPLEAAWSEHLRLKWLVADLRLDILRGQCSRKYRPDQPRDDRGRWVDDGPTDISAARRLPGGIAKKFWGWTVRQFVSQHCKGQINRELPTQFDDVTIADILELRKGGNAAADKCYKLLNEPRFRKK